MRRLKAKGSLIKSLVGDTISSSNASTHVRRTGSSRLERRRGRPFYTKFPQLLAFGSTSLSPPCLCAMCVVFYLFACGTQRRGCKKREATTIFRRTRAPVKKVLNLSANAAGQALALKKCQTQDREGHPFRHQQNY
jgi:hypothetical protein